METFNVLIYFFFTTLLVVECQDNVPDIYYSCAPDGLLITVSFPKPFYGVVFAQDHYAIPKCSTPNMAASVTQEVQLNLPLLKCGTKVRRRNRSLVENTINIQYHPILTTVFDYSINITCRLKERLPNEFWNSYRRREQKPNTKYDSWIEFKSGNKVFGEMESQLLGVSSKQFLVVYVKDGGRSKHLLVDKCIAHQDRIVNENTPVAVLSEPERCPTDSLNEFSLRANSSVSDLVAFAEVLSVNVSLEGFYITCALEMCKEVCPQPCRYGIETSRWSSVSTHRIEKRSLEVPDQTSDDPGPKKNLKSSVQAMIKKLRTLRLLQTARRTENKLKKSTETDKSTSITLTSEEESLITETLPELNRLGRIYSLKLDTSLGDPELVNVTKDASETTPEFTSNANNCSDTDCITTVVNERVEDHFSNLTQANASQTNDTLSSQELLSNTSTTANVSINYSRNFEKIYINGTEQYSNVTSSCIPKFKFVSVTASLSVLTVCFFLICVGLILHLRKERKKHLLDSYLLYNFF